MLDQKMKELGFEKTSEKEELVFFEKTLFNEKDQIHQVCIVYDKSKKQIKSADTYVIDGEEMKLVKDKIFEREMKQHLIGL